jgi:hypothetical protein
MARTLTIELPADLDDQLTAQAEKRGISLESLVLQCLTQSVAQMDEDEDLSPEELAYLRQSLREAKASNTRSISDLWNGIIARFRES